ncbi:MULTISPECIES: transcription elongation factor GreB [Spongiibacter]|mgnify:CR=1 FL=1|uniref:transcription elongation factor GreB n=1 Tax=Spongiibacter TaxID=630749 RepID=UPI0003B54964|nr:MULTISPECIES: transcription elongation factor GreB [Spongiibacter]MAY38240.1 transcription elongation factor GreB [Spongiibacter sp.]MBI57994.1 transcription elongation factor GreB [Spongiibacter sp.]|tara:strand:+ start:588 stop:1106 length:519 start_codon:yes stop_codon:yes gene_type:complete
MSRYRPPRARGSRYITPEGERALREELRQLWKVERPQVTAAVHEAAKNGDRSENGDYIYGKKRLREIDSRVRFLGKRLDELKVVDTLPSDRDKIFFGAWVTLEDDDGEETCYRIVGPDEFDLASGKLSMDAPLARAMLGKRLDDEVLVSTPTGEKCYYVCAIHYGDKPDTNT